MSYVFAFSLSRAIKKCRWPVGRHKDRVSRAPAENGCPLALSVTQSSKGSSRVFVRLFCAVGFDRSKFVTLDVPTKSTAVFFLSLPKESSPGNVFARASLASFYTPILFQCQTNKARLSRLEINEPNRAASGKARRDFLKKSTHPARTHHARQVYEIAGRTRSETERLI